MKVPLIGCPGTECGRQLLEGGRSEVVQSFKDEFGPCEEPGRWLVGSLFVCQEHAAKVAEEIGDNIDAIEKAVMEKLRA
jgi:hypothetical protein